MQREVWDVLEHLHALPGDLILKEPSPNADFCPVEYTFLNTHPLPFNSTLCSKVELVRLPLTKQLVRQSSGTSLAAAGTMNSDW